MNFWRETEKLCFLLATWISTETQKNGCKIHSQFYSNRKHYNLDKRKFIPMELQYLPVWNILHVFIKHQCFHLIINQDVACVYWVAFTNHQPLKRFFPMCFMRRFCTVFSSSNPVVFRRPWMFDKDGFESFWYHKTCLSCCAIFKNFHTQVSNDYVYK